eukprot:jgi/Bigna1/82370/fgenesh1_pg.91_\
MPDPTRRMMVVLTAMASMPKATVTSHSPHCLRRLGTSFARKRSWRLSTLVNRGVASSCAGLSGGGDDESGRPPLANSKGRKGDVEGKRMKRLAFPALPRFEDETAKRGYIDPSMPFIMRLDGHRFHTVEREWVVRAVRLSKAMVLTTRDLLRHYHSATCAYVQSDEITLVFPSAMATANVGVDDDNINNPAATKDMQSMLTHRGRLQKLASLCAGLASVRFNYNLSNSERWGSLVMGATMMMTTMITHDDDDGGGVEGCKNVLWRFDDCIRNSQVLMAQQHFSHEQLYKGYHCAVRFSVKVSSKAAVHKLKAAKGIDWRDTTPEFRFGSLLKREKYVRDGYDPKRQIPTKNVLMAPTLNAVLTNLPPSKDGGLDDEGAGGESKEGSASVSRCAQRFLSFVEEEAATIEEASGSSAYPYTDDLDTGSSGHSVLF